MPFKKKQFISFYTILRKGIARIMRIWPQTLLPSVITSVLYFAVFGNILGSRIGELNGVPYILFVVPGLVMLAVITNSFTDVATTFFVYHPHCRGSSLPALSQAAWREGC